MTGPAWNAHLYDTRHGFVAAYGTELIGALAPQPGERILDAGCGTGEHAAQLAEAGADVVGVDASAEMVERGRARFPGLDLRVGDLRTLEESGFDAVLSNAVLHWIPEAGRAAAALAGALRPGGRLSAELGGAGNVAAIEAAARAVRAEQGLPAPASPWYFPGIAEYAAVLEDAGFEVVEARLFERPTPLDGPDALTAWLDMFAPHLTAGAPEPAALGERIAERLRPALFRGGRWYADYRRLRIRAVRTG